MQQQLSCANKLCKNTCRKLSGERSQPEALQNDTAIEWRHGTINYSHLHEEETGQSISMSWHRIPMLVLGSAETHLILTRDLPHKTEQTKATSIVGHWYSETATGASMRQRYVLQLEQL